MKYTLKKGLSLFLVAFMCLGLVSVTKPTTVAAAPTYYENLAAEKPVRGVYNGKAIVNDKYNGSTSAPMSRMTDGNYTTFLKLDNGAYDWEFVIDLGAEKSFNTINFREINYHLYKNYEVYVTSDILPDGWKDATVDEFNNYSAEWEHVESGYFRQNVDKKNNFVSNEIYFDTVQARYIKLIVKDRIRYYTATHGRVAEIEVFNMNEPSLSDKNYANRSVYDVTFSGSDTGTSFATSSNAVVEKLLTLNKTHSGQNINATHHLYPLQQTNLNETNNVWFSIDLGTERDINRVEIVPEKDNINNISLYYAPSKEVYNEVISYAGTTANAARKSLPQSVIAKLRPLTTKTGMGSISPQVVNGAWTEETLFPSRDYVIKLDFENKDIRYIVAVITDLSGTGTDDTICKLWSVEAYDYDLLKGEYKKPIIKEFEIEYEVYSTGFSTISNNLLGRKSVTTGSATDTSNKIVDCKVNSQTSFWESENNQSDYVFINLKSTTLIDKINIIEKYNRIADYALKYTSEPVNENNFEDADWKTIEESVFEQTAPASENIKIEHLIEFAPITATGILFEINSGYGEESQNFVLEEIRGYYTSDGSEINLANLDENSLIKADTNLPVSTTYDISKMLSPSTDGVGSIQFMKSASVNATNSWCVVDLSEIRTINRVQFVPLYDRFKNYYLYYTNDSSMYNQMESVAVNYGLTEGIISGLTPITDGPISLPELNTLDSGKTDPVNPTNNSRNYVVTTDFEPINARYIVLVVDDWRFEGQNNGLWSFEVYNHKEGDSDFYTPDGTEEEYDGSSYQLGNMAKKSTVTSNAKYFNEKIGSNIKTLNNGKKFEGDERLYITGDIPVNFDFDFGTTVPIDTVVLYEFGSNLGECTVYISDDGNNWEYVTEYTANVYSDDVTPQYTELTFETSFGRYMRLEVGECNGLAAISEVEVYNKNSSALFALQLGYDDLTDESPESITADLIALPESITFNGETASVSWSSSDESVINSQTGEVTRPGEDEAVVLTAEITVGVSDVISRNFTFTVLEDSFVNSVEVDSIDNGAASYTFVPENGFKLNKSFMIETELSGEGTAEFNLGSKVLEVGVSDGTLTVKEKGGDKALATYNVEADFGLKVEVKDNCVSAFVDAGSGYRNILSRKGFGTCELIGINFAGDFNASDVKVSIIEDEILDLIENQLTFEKFTNEKHFALESALNLFESVYGAEFTYSVEGSPVIDDAGNLTSVGVASLNVSASYEENSIEKSFEILAGNLFSDATVRSTAVANGSGDINYLCDGDTTTYYSTKIKNYEITVTLPESTYITDFVLKELAGSEITSFEILVSEDGTNYDSVYTGESIGDETIGIVPTKCKSIKLVVKDASGTTNGISEFAGFYLPDSIEKINVDFLDVKIPSESTGEFTLPAVGGEGTVFSYTSDKNYISFVEEDGHYAINIENPENSEYAYLTVKAVNGEDSAEKIYKVLIKGTKSIHENKPSSGGGGGGGGGGSSLEDTVGEPDQGGNGVVADKEETPAPVVTPEEVLKNDVKNHWAEKEVSALIDLGIVTGDENKKLNLSNEVTRAEFATMIVKALGLKSENADCDFSDVKANDWYYQTVAICTENGIIQGSDNKFRPNDKITREEMAVILYRCLGNDLTVESEGNFADADFVSVWAEDAVGNISSAGLIKGYEDGTFKPANSLKRAEAMVVIYRLLEMGGAE